MAPFSSVSSQLSLNIDNTLKPSNAYQLSNKSGAADVTLDLQLKPPTRPELGISWKGLAPDPELSLSLFVKQAFQCTNLKELLRLLQQFRKVMINSLYYHF